MATSFRRVWSNLPLPEKTWIYVGRISGMVLSRCAQRLLSSQTTLTAASTAANERINRVVQAYEDIVGLAEVRDAQDRVIKAERKFLGTQERRRDKQQNLALIQSRLRAISTDREKTNKGEKKYLELVTQEHNIIQEERGIEVEANSLEVEERDHFALLSSVVRESHEKERARAERTKYWSLIGSVIGATIGIIGTSVNNYFRMKELRGMIKDSTSQGQEFQGLVAQLADTTKTQFNRMEEFLLELRTELGSSGETTLQKAVGQSPNAKQPSEILEKQTKEILEIVRRQDSAVEKEMKDIKRLLATERARTQEANVVYVGPEVEGLLQETQDNLTWKIKLGSLATVTAIYSGVAIGIGIIYSIFKGS